MSAERAMSTRRQRLVVIGASWGGATALAELLAALGPAPGAAVAVALHRHPDSDDRVLLPLLRRAGALPVHPVEDKDPVVAGRACIAPPDYHLLVERGSFALSVDERVSFARPSVDVLFESAADAYGASTVAVVLTGSGHDGAAGVRRVRARGGAVLVQDPASAERPEMPNAALASGPADGVGDPRWLGCRLAELCRP